MNKIIFSFAGLALLFACAPDTVSDNKEVAALDINLNKSEIELPVGETETLIATVEPTNSTDKVVWYSSDDGVATVKDGLVTAIAPGSATITAKAGSQMSNCTVKVVQKFNIEAVNIGLTVKWANANLGAGAPEEYGDYYAWGEIETYYSSLDPLIWKEGKSGYDWESYKWGIRNGSESTVTKYCPANETYYWGGDGAPDNKTQLEEIDDVAHVKLGGNWRLPTFAEICELLDTRENHISYKWEWTTINGYTGWLVTYLINNNSIFLPASGYMIHESPGVVGIVGGYWSSSLNAYYPDEANRLFIRSDLVTWYGCTRCNSNSVRAVTR